jgi:L-lysine 2,3-aminomutase
MHPDMKSVIVTGGEPLILSTSKLNSILTKLQEIESVKHGPNLGQDLLL